MTAAQTILTTLASAGRLGRAEILAQTTLNPHSVDAAIKRLSNIGHISRVMPTPEQWAAGVRTAYQITAAGEVARMQRERADRYGVNPRATMLPVVLEALSMDTPACVAEVLDRLDQIHGPEYSWQSVHHFLVQAVRKGLAARQKTGRQAPGLPAVRYTLTAKGQAHLIAWEAAKVAA